MNNTQKLYSLKINKLLWDDANNEGYRNVTVCIDSVNVMCIVSHRVNGTWESSIVPLGYRHSKEQVLILKEFYSIAYDIMQYLECDSITEIEIQEYIDSL